jgi:hypothetical protein
MMLWLVIQFSKCLLIDVFWFDQMIRIIEFIAMSDQLHLLIKLLKTSINVFSRWSFSENTHE